LVHFYWHDCSSINGNSSGIPFLPPAAASKKRKRSFSGAPRTPAKGWPPFAILLKILQLTPKIDIHMQNSNKKRRSSQCRDERRNAFVVPP
jgi:hypothetical protein